MKPDALCNVAAVIGAGHTDWQADYRAVRSGEKPFDCYGYGATALRRAIDDAGIRKSDIDGVIVGPTTSIERSCELYGINPRWSSQADAVQAVVQATMTIKAGMASVVALVYGNDQRSAKIQYGGPEAMGGGAHLSYVYHAPWGLTSQGALYALMYRRYMEVTGATERDLGQVSVAERQWGSTNPHAIMRKTFTLDEYIASTHVAEPLHLYDYCLINDGGVALIVAEASRAKELSAKKPVMIRGIARADMHDESSTLKPRLIDFYHPGHHIVREAIYGATGLGPKDMDGVLVYDSFSCHIPFALEGFGFCAEGEAGKFIAETGIGPGGKLPVNSSGGHLSESYMQGWNHQVEALRRLRGEVGHPTENCRHIQYISDVAGKVFSIIYGV